MASLKKPSSCPECPDITFKRKFKPERWICGNGHIALIRKPRPKGLTCTKCGIGRAKTPFRKNSTLCVPCAKKRSKDYYHTSKEKLREYYRNRKNRAKSKTTIRGWLYYLRKRAAQRCRRSKNPVEITISTDYLHSLYLNQQGLCALSKLPMSYGLNSMRALSIDRINSSKGYIEGNIQLVCCSINYMKNAFNNDDVLQFLEDIRLDEETSC